MIAHEKQTEALRGGNRDPTLAPTPAHVSSIEPSHIVILPDGQVLGRSSDLRICNDLVLHGADGEVFIVRDYFVYADRPLLVGTDRGRMTHHIVDAFSFKQEEAEVAQAGEIDAPGAIATAFWETERDAE